MVPRHTRRHLSYQFPCLPQSPMAVKCPAKVEKPETEQRGGTVGQDMTVLNTTEISVLSPGDSSTGEGTCPASLAAWVSLRDPHKGRGREPALWSFRVTATPSPWHFHTRHACAHVQEP